MPIRLLKSEACHKQYCSNTGCRCGLIAVAQLQRGAQFGGRDGLDEKLYDARAVRLNNRLALGAQVVAALFGLRQQQAAHIERLHDLLLHVREYKLTNLNSTRDARIVA